MILFQPKVQMINIMDRLLFSFSSFSQIKQPRFKLKILDSFMLQGNIEQELPPSTVDSLQKKSLTKNCNYSLKYTSNATSKF